MRFALAALLNGVLMSLAALLHGWGRPWQQWTLGPFVMGGMFVVPWIFMRKSDGAKAELREVMVRNAVAWLLGLCSRCKSFTR